MKIHNPTPCIKGFVPTDFNLLIDKPLPIKNKVMVNPFFAIITKTEYVELNAGIYVPIIMVRMNNPMK
jgi:hypothetical protein